MNVWLGLFQSLGGDRAALQTCSVCGAVVTGATAETHAQWHREVDSQHDTAYIVGKEDE